MPDDPNVSISQTDNALGTLAPSSAGKCWVIGASSGGVAGTVYSFRGSDTTQAKNALVSGGGLDAVVHMLLKSDGGTVYYYEGAKSTAGANSAVTASGGGPTVTLSGTPVDDYNAIVKITAGGALGTSTFQVSLDAGRNYSPIIATAATYLIPGTGVTVNFAAGTYVLDETYSWTSTGPKNTNTDIGNAFDAILANSLIGEFVYVPGQAATTADMATIATTLNSKCVTSLSAQKPMFALVEMPLGTAAANIAELAGDEWPHVMAIGGAANIANDVSNRNDKRSIGRSVAARILRNPISIAISRKKDDSDLDPLAGVDVPDNQAAATSYHLENATPGYNAARATYVKKYVGRGGVYIGNANMMAAATSDFLTLQYRRIINAAQALVYPRALTFVQKRVLTNANGTILESEAQAIETVLDGALRQGLVAIGHASRAVAVINRSDNLLSDPTLRIKIRVTPPGYANEIEVEIGFFVADVVALAA